MTQVFFKNKYGEECTLMKGEKDDVFLTIGEGLEAKIYRLSLEGMKKFINAVDKDVEGKEL